MTTELGNILYVLTGFLLFVYLGERECLTANFFSIATVLLALCGILHYYHAESLASQYLAGYDEDRFTNNASVIFLCLLPSLLYVKNNIVKYSILLVCIFFIITSVKRGNIIAAIIPIVIILWSSLRNAKGSFYKTVIIFVVIIGFFLLVRKWILGNEYFLYRFEQTLEGSLSDRNLIYSSAWGLWVGSNSIVHLLFGFGFDATISHLYNHYRAHSDWLEVLVNYGLVGVVLYLTVFINLFKVIIRTKDYQTKLVMIAVSSVWFLKSCYSMGFSDEYVCLLAIPLGAAVGSYKSQLYYK